MNHQYRGRKEALKRVEREVQARLVMGANDDADDGRKKRRVGWMLVELGENDEKATPSSRLKSSKTVAVREGTEA